MAGIILRAEIPELLSRARRARQPDRQLDKDILKACGATITSILAPKDHPMFKPGGGLEFMTFKDGKQEGVWPVSYSADAALALVLEMVPCACPILLRFPNGKWGAGVSDGMAPPQLDPHEAASAPLALLCALLKAMIGQAPQAETPAPTNLPGHA